MFLESISVYYKNFVYYVFENVFYKMIYKLTKINKVFISNATNVTTVLNSKQLFLFYYYGTKIILGTVCIINKTLLPPRSKPG